MQERIAFIGFGEAGQAFAPDLRASFSAYDPKADKHIDYERCRVVGCADAGAALSGAVAALSLVTADQALAAAKADAPLLAASALWFDMNSVAPDTKRAAAEAIEAAGGRYVDVAVMAPVHPARTGVPLLVSGPHAGAGADLLRRIGFLHVRVVPGGVGRASAIKMIRSVMIKGIEALTAECTIAAARAGVLDEVIGSLDAGAPPPAWGARADYNLDRMMVHGRRRAAEMEEVVKTLESLGIRADLTRGTVVRQRAIGALGHVDPPAGLAAKLAALNAEDAA